MLTFFVWSCNNKNATKEDIFISTDSSIFYPVNEYFKTQILKGDSFSVIRYTYIDSDNKNDSAIITSAKFKELANPFLKDDINDRSIKKYYRESIFHDVTTASNTFTYTSVTNKLPLQTLDILLDTITNNVKRVFIAKNFTKGDSTIIEKMGWKTGESFFINRIVQLPGNKETTQQITVSWSSND
ncbi:hypothetical protein FRZ67_09470 [Panacibacter ginsenosidivorans]|uniref:Uncharacterized protein n=1 Tax=Panacibacter ginsenosidivorans TaxID=1813871 RepID=A0A5B8V9A9_9BACT|nr:hypothetical protein [Panacibacter ginsenosidivorans]QEC67513.1 hypothetical protein FRZ67_09470 [Panacibacter ginsenosidivorans]